MVTPNKRDGKKREDDIKFIKSFHNVIEQLIQMHKDINTTYSPTKMFHSSNDLSFAISRLLDAENIFASETLENKAMTQDLRTMWFDTRESMPKETAQNLAICIIKNTPLSKTSEEIASIKELFLNAMYDFTDHKELSNVLTEIIFKNDTGQNIDKRQFKKPKKG